MVLVGHCTLNDCAVAVTVATPISASTKVLTIFLDMRSPPPASGVLTLLAVHVAAVLMLAKYSSD